MVRQHFGDIVVLYALLDGLHVASYHHADDLHAFMHDT
jgi:hypothetical protein